MNEIFKNKFKQGQEVLIEFCNSAYDSRLCAIKSRYVCSCCEGKKHYRYTSKYSVYIKCKILSKQKINGQWGYYVYYLPNKWKIENNLNGTGNKFFLYTKDILLPAKIYCNKCGQSCKQNCYQIPSIYWKDPKK